MGQMTAYYPQSHSEARSSEYAPSRQSRHVLAVVVESKEEDESSPASGALSD
jgi:hypothetical protein